MLWYPAQLALDRPVPKDWSYYHECLKWTRDHDPDPNERAKAAESLRVHEIWKNVDPATGRPRSAAPASQPSE